MTDTHDTIAGIIAEIRALSNPISDGIIAINGRIIADRIEAAHKRETVTGSNQLREALKLCLRGMCGYCRMDAEARGMTTECVNGCEALLMAKAALAAPPRNCDKVKTSWDVLKKWHEGLDTENDIVRMLDWLFAPATEKEGGEK